MEPTSESFENRIPTGLTQTAENDVMHFFNNSGNDSRSQILNTGRSQHSVDVAVTRTEIRGSMQIAGSLPGIGGSMPGMGGSLPGMGGSLPGMGGSMPGMGGSLPGMGGAMPGMGGSMPGMGGSMPGMGGSLPGMGGAMPGMGGAMPGMGGSLPGMGGSLPGIEGAMPGMGGRRRGMPGIGGGTSGIGGGLSNPINNSGLSSGLTEQQIGDLLNSGQLNPQQMQQIQQLVGQGADHHNASAPARNGGNPNNGEVHDFITQLVEYESFKVSQCPDPIAPGMNTVIVVDTSASMAGEPLQTVVGIIKDIMKDIEHCAIEYALEENVAIVSFGAENYIAQNLTNDFAKVLEVLDTFHADGSSPLYLAIILSMVALRRQLSPESDCPKPRIIMISDYNTSKPAAFSDNSADLPESEEQKVQNKNHIISCIQEVYSENGYKFYFIPVGAFDEVLPDFMADATKGKVLKPAASKWLGRSHLHHTIAASLKKTPMEITHDMVRKLANKTIAQDDLFDQDIVEIISICKERDAEDSVNTLQSSTGSMTNPSSQRTQTGGIRSVSSIISNQYRNNSQPGSHPTPVPLSGLPSSSQSATLGRLVDTLPSHQETVNNSMTNIPQPSNSQAQNLSVTTDSVVSHQSRLLTDSQSSSNQQSADLQAYSNLRSNNLQTSNLQQPNFSERNVGPHPVMVNMAASEHPSSETQDTRGSNEQENQNQASSEELTAEQVMKQLMEFYVPPDTSNLPIMPDLGTKVRKGPDWLKLYDKEVPVNEVGEVISCYGDDKKGWVRVKWLSRAFEEDYRYGLESEFDVVPLDGLEAVQWPAGKSYVKKPTTWQIPDSSDEEDVQVENISQQEGNTGGALALLTHETEDTQEAQEIENNFDVPVERPDISNNQGHFVWQYLNDQGDWTSYYQDIQQKLENSFQQRPKGTELIKYGLQSERISFSQMKQRNTQSGEEKPIRRIEIDLEQFQQLMNINES